MGKFIRASLIKDRTTATEVLPVDLPVNPLSHLIISMDGMNVGDEATLAEILAFINVVEVTHLGKTVLSLESEDLAALNAYLYGSMPQLTQNLAAATTARCLSLIVPFGRKIFDPDECFPATTRGELTLSLDTTVPSASLDGSTLNIEAVQLMGATPSRYLKVTSKSVSAPGATGVNDVALPIGNDIVALLLWMTTFPATASSTYGIDGVKVLVDNLEEGFAFARAQCLTGDLIFRLSNLPRDIGAFGDILPDNTVWLDYDPRGDGQWLLETAGKSSVTLQLDMGVDEASRVTIVELVDVTP